MTTDDKPMFEVAKPPRAIPRVTRRKLLFGGPINQTGWIFAGIGLIVFWVFGLDCEFWNTFTFSGTSEFTQGQVTDVDETNMSENEETIYKIAYRYTVGGREYRGFSYGTSGFFDAGEPVSIEYLEAEPASSRIEGMRRYRFSWWAIFVVIFPAIGIGIVGFGLRAGRRAIYILTQGRPTMGRMLGRETTGTTVNERPQWKVFFEYTDDRGRTGKGSIKTFTPEKVEDDEFERLLYDPADPASIVLVDALPGNVVINDEGRFEAGGMSLHYLLAPAATAVIVVAMLLSAAT